MSCTVASLLCGLAQTPAELIAARLVQGLAAAAMVPQVLAMITACPRPGRAAYAHATVAALWIDLALTLVIAALSPILAPRRAGTPASKSPRQPGEGHDRSLSVSNEASSRQSSPRVTQSVSRQPIAEHLLKRVRYRDCRTSIAHDHPEASKPWLLT